MNEHANSPEHIIIGTEPVLVGRSPLAVGRLLHPTVSREHATLRRRGSELEIIDLDSRFGTFINGVRIKSSLAKDGDRLQFGTATTYRVRPDGLRADLVSRGVQLTAAGLVVSRTGNPPLLRDVGLEVRPDSFVGILGPSGAGKSTLLRCLASLNLPDAGGTRYDGEFDTAEKRDAFRAILGYVPQDDVVYTTLTVRENLRFAAPLRLGTDSDITEIEDAVQLAMEKVGLSAGDAEKQAGVLSGGQRKRLSVAIELLRRPRLLLLDEPTSGLDPASEANLMEQLRYVASRGTTVLCTTHMMDNVRLFDEVIVLGVHNGSGQIAYQGAPHDLLSHFQCRSFADLYERLGAGRFEPIHSVSPSVVSTARDNTIEAPPLPSLSTIEPASHPSEPYGWSRERLSEILSRTVEDSRFKQAVLVAKRGLLQVSRDPSLWKLLLGQALALPVLVGLTQFDASKGLPIYFFSVVLAIWFGLNNSAREIVRERRHYVRERLAGLDPAAYLAAKGVVLISIGFVQVLIALVALRLVTHFAIDLTKVNGEIKGVSWAWWLLVLLTTYAGGAGLGLLASTKAKTEEEAVAWLPLLIMPQLLLSVVTVGASAEFYSGRRPLRPLVITLHSPLHQTGSKGESLPGGAVVVDGLSLVCFSRPAALILDPEVGSIANYSKWIWLLDALHLFALVLVTWIAVYFYFRRVEPDWPRQVRI